MTQADICGLTPLVWGHVSRQLSTRDGRALSADWQMAADKVLEDLRGVGGPVLRTSFDRTQEAALREALAVHAATEGTGPSVPPS
jgi:hypothetical protein